jgi:hypothetical protein
MRKSRFTEAQTLVMNEGPAGGRSVTDSTTRYAMLRAGNELYNLTPIRLYCHLEDYFFTTMVHRKLCWRDG